MEITYVSEINNNYMIIKEEGMLPSFAENMLIRNNIDGALKLEIEDINGEYEYKYVINAKQTLEKYFKYQSFNVETLKRFVLDLNKTMVGMRNYLIKEKNLLLTKESIFYNPLSKEFSFCVFPGTDRDITNDLREIFRFVLSRVDHDDQESIYLGYDLQELTMKDNFCMEILLDRLTNETASPKENQKETANREPNNIEEEDKKDFLSEFKLDTELFDEIRKTEYESDKRFETGKLPNLKIFKKLSRIGDDKEKHEIKKFPFIIGKSGADVDLKLDNAVVSRFHAVITYDGKKYYIEDMNSKNGTFVNGKRIEPYKKAKISDGDDVSFANLAYEFF